MADDSIYINVPTMPWLNTLLVPKLWPLRARRAFVLTLPVSGPLLIAAWGAVSFILLCAVLVIAPIGSLTEICKKLWQESDNG